MEATLSRLRFFALAALVGALPFEAGAGEIAVDNTPERWELRDL